MDTHGPNTVSYPHKVLTKIIGKPTADDIKILKKQLFANNQAAYLTRGRGKHGHLGVILSATVYANKTKATTPWTKPQHPGANPTHTRQKQSPKATASSRAHLPNSTYVNRSKEISAK